MKLSKQKTETGTKKSEIETAKTDLGTSEIYKRHSVMVEGGAIPRARVMDQCVIDRLLMAGVLTLSQHSAGEHLLNKAVQGGLYVRGGGWDLVASSGSAGSNVPVALEGYRRLVRSLVKRLGADKSRIVVDVVCHNQRCEGASVDILKEGLDWIGGAIGHSSPLRHLD